MKTNGKYKAGNVLLDAIALVSAAHRGVDEIVRAARDPETRNFAQWLDESGEQWGRRFDAVEQELRGLMGQLRTP